MDPTGSTCQIDGVKKICKQEKRESTRFKLVIIGYKKSHHILHFWLILLQTFVNLLNIISQTKQYRDKLISVAENGGQWDLTCLEKKGQKG